MHGLSRTCMKNMLPAGICDCGCLNREMYRGWRPCGAVLPTRRHCDAISTVSMMKSIPGRFRRNPEYRSQIVVSGGRPWHRAGGVSRTSVCSGDFRILCLPYGFLSCRARSLALDGYRYAGIRGVGVYCRLADLPDDRCAAVVSSFYSFAGIRNPIFRVERRSCRIDRNRLI